ncbi:unnamed protein product [Protopolystoma xenopodis]|uniref:Uncharacterized protein n=1 Tax=Protopolystoma xenopodis TaxID=117903 RepID=A0A3S5CUM0_9PLAT|nr:unnamed protein product [Protopolystoma xenopodis]
MGLARDLVTVVGIRSSEVRLCSCAAYMRADTTRGRVMRRRQFMPYLSSRRTDQANTGLQAPAFSQFPCSKLMRIKGALRLLPFPSSALRSS